MPSAEILIPFFVATSVFAYMPGPSTLYAAVQTIACGRRAGWFAALGIHVGGYVHVIAASLGISVLFTAVPLLYSIVKLAGACYLVCLGILLFRTRGEMSNIVTREENTRTTSSAFWQSITVEVLNPKTAIFYIAFLPQFIDPSSALPFWGQLVILGTIVNIMFSSADVLCVIFSSTVVKYFEESSVGRRIVQRIGGCVLVGLGINLAISRQ